MKLDSDTNLRLFKTGLILLSGISQCSAATLILTDPSGITVPNEAHADDYLFPSQLLDTSNPIESLELNYLGNISSPTGHEILSATFLFHATQITSITPSVDTADQFQAVVEFAIPVTDVSQEFNPAFRAVHGEIKDISFTELTWTATYADGSQRSITTGIIPEPTSLAGVLLASMIAGFRRKRIS